MRDITSNLLVKRAISPVSVADNTAQVSQIIDRQGYDSVMFAILTGSLADTDATFAVLLEESNVSNFGTSNAVADEDMNSHTYGTAPETAAAFTFAADDNVRKIGYNGNKRYLRLTITPSANASAALLAAVAILGNPGQAPVTQTAS
jgi:hypothetical protein